MATFSKRNLTINNFQDPVSYTSGKGTQTKTYQMYNFMDNKLRFLMDEYDCVIYELTKPNFLPNLAVKFYGTSSLWWIIARFNGIIFPLREIKVGTKLAIPQLNEISKFLNQAQTKTSSENSKRIIL